MCIRDRYVMDELLYQYGVSLVASSKAASDLVKEYSLALDMIRDDHQTLNQIFKQHFVLGAQQLSDCPAQNDYISVQELGGLWIVTLAVVGVATVLFFIKKLKCFSFPKNYMSPYYKYHSPKSELFEKQLKEAIRFEMSKIIKAYKEQLENEITSFEATLMMQDDETINGGGKVGYEESSSVFGANETKGSKYHKMISAISKKDTDSKMQVSQQLFFRVRDLYSQILASFFRLRPMSHFIHYMLKLMRELFSANTFLRSVGSLSRLSLIHI
eukprot:TRINITY_DN8368_c0_g2_i2.p1 TRINITY_DN8368_c0_g2~~TRINITY_DN8368_c0_g2_i2.p1  ORF type:complete len:308 (+),score=59.21 TRINITY_DN8368_c0_g2_i2:114-926(+)